MGGTTLHSLDQIASFSPFSPFPPFSPFSPFSPFFETSQINPFDDHIEFKSKIHVILFLEKLMKLVRKPMRVFDELVVLLPLVTVQIVRIVA
jgi:hypothetical protein